MAKKKKNFSSWFRQEINTKFSYFFILLLFLLCVLIAYIYSIPSIGIPIENQGLIYFQTFVYNLSDNSEPSSPTPTPNPPNYYLLKFPSATPTPSPIPKQLPNQNFDLLRIYQTGSRPGATSNVKVIIDITTINRIYNDIENLPVMLPGTYNCPIEFLNALQYSLNFYVNNTLTISALVHTSGCGVVEISPHYQTRMAVGPQGEKLLEDLQKL